FIVGGQVGRNGGKPHCRIFQPLYVALATVENNVQQRGEPDIVAAERLKPRHECRIGASNLGRSAWDVPFAARGGFVGNTNEIEFETLSELPFELGQRRLYQ